MRRSKQILRVKKVPLETQPIQYPQEFKAMPRLYLELIENKDKIKQDLINVEYEPSSRTSQRSISPEMAISPQPPSPVKEIPIPSINENIKETYNDEDKPIYSPEKEIPKSFMSDKQEIQNENDGSDDALSERLQELLGQSNGDNESPEFINTHSEEPEVPVESFTRPIVEQEIRKTTTPIIKKSFPKTAPSLKEIQQKSSMNNLRNLNSPNTNEVNEEDAKRELLFKFELLKKSYPVSDIPEYSIHTDLYVMERSYKDCVRRLSLDSSVESYKTYLVYGFMGCEFVLGNFFGFDMSGFTQQQIISMHSYEKLLIEIGEKSYVPTEQNWPVEVRLIFAIIMNAAFFIISKMMMQKTGTNLMNMVNNMNGSKPAAQNNQEGGRKKMRGPNL